MDAISDATSRHDARWRVVPVLALVLLATMLAACGSTAVSGSGPTVQEPPIATPATPASRPPPTAAPAKPAGQTARPTPAAPARPAGASGTPAAASSAKPSGSVEVDREQIAREATWAPGQLEAHVEKHGREGPWPTEAAFDASARETIRIGTVFTYLDRESHAERLGFYDRETNRFASVTRDGRRITTQFKPDRGEAYVRGLTRSTYR